MRFITRIFSAALLATAAVLGGCGGGSATVDAEVVVPVAVATPVATFDLIMFANGQRVSGVNLFPSQEQDVYLVAGSNFELASSGPVAWTVAVNGAVVSAPVGSVISYTNANVLPTLITNARYAANTNRSGPLPSQGVVLSVIATSLSDPSQEAQINIVLTN